MNYITGTSREQLTIFPTSLDSAVSADNEVRIIDAFVNSLDMCKLGFLNARTSTEGRPAYNPADLLKLFIYGYMNRTRSSRELEKETKRNLEVMWLLNGLQPDHNTISNFRRDNPEAIRKVFNSTVSIAKHYNLIGGKLLAGDSVKLRAQNSKKNNYNADKIARHTEYINKKLSEYEAQLSSADNDVQKQAIESKIQEQNNRKAKYDALSKELEETGKEQISTSDPDSRHMIVRGSITEVAYNIQTVNDAKHNLILDYLTTQNNDTHALSPMVKRAIDIVEHNDFTVLYDKGYHTGSEIAACHRMGIETLVAVPSRPVTSMAPDPAFNVEAFTYNPQTDSYICPAGQTLTTNGTTYTSKASHFKQYYTKDCKGCKLLSQCTASKKQTRIIQRSEHIENIERNGNYLQQHPELYKRRQTIVEHPYGTIKRQWGFDHTLIKRGIQRVSADIGLIFAVYNLRRLMNMNCIKPTGKLSSLKNTLLELIFGVIEQSKMNFIYFYTRLNSVSMSLKTFQKTVIFENSFCY